jgi:hypothetical protein
MASLDVCLLATGGGRWRCKRHRHGQCDDALIRLPTNYEKYYMRAIETLDESLASVDGRRRVRRFADSSERLSGTLARRAAASVRSNSMAVRSAC